MKKAIVFLLLLFLSVTAAFSQELRLVVSAKPLNAVLNSLNIEISFDDKALSKYTVTVSKTFSSPAAAIQFLLKDKPLKVEKVGSVFVISPAREANEPKLVALPAKPRVIISGEVIDKSSGEPLSYAHLQTHQGLVTTNEAGYFSFVCEDTRPVMVMTSYLGYEPLDTLLSRGNHKLFLSPIPIALEEVTVKPTASALFMQSGKTAGEIRSNHQIARYMPGSSDNSVFNLLRMMPGVRASGEPSEDLIVWGSNWGESRLTYDGFTIFGLKSFNDQISSVNPYLAKDICLQKGGQDASGGNRIGAIAEITGVDGDFTRMALKANLSNYTGNIYTSVPIIRNRSALSVAYRQTFYNLYEKENVGKENSAHEQVSLSDTYIKPNYDFRDVNVKYVGKTIGGDRYHVSLYGADDHFKFNVSQRDFAIDATEKNRQLGASSGYSWIWNDGSQSKALLTFSRLAAIVDNVSGITTAQSSTSSPLDVFTIRNNAQELALKIEHNFNIGTIHRIQIGGEWQYLTCEFNATISRLCYPSLYATDRLLFGKLSVDAGIRMDIAVNGRTYLQPRLSARYRWSDEITTSASFGMYNQFLTRVPFQYRPGSYQMIWNLADNTSLSSIHYLTGIAYSKNGWLMSAEAFIKSNRNQHFFVDNAIYATDNTISGIDLLMKKGWGKHQFWGSYSLVHATKPEFSTGHEVKAGTVYFLKPFYLSATYVYGSGFPYLSTSEHGHGEKNENGQHGNEYRHSDTSRQSYNRLDLSATYRLQLRGFCIQAGASVINVFNTNNVKYSYRLSDKNSVYNVYTKATPLTPILFLEFIF